MTRILAIGDVVGEGGIRIIEQHLSETARKEKADLVIVNGENTAMRGAKPEHLVRLYRAGADVITLGNHTWGNYQLAPKLQDLPYVIRPYNFAPNLPGNGALITEAANGIKIGVVNMIGRGNLDFNASNPFLAADQLLKRWEGQCDITVFDFHAEMTSEKGAFGYYLDGRASVVFGTHTHVPTADNRILPKGTGFVTDLGMTGARNSVLGIDPAISINLFLGGIPQKYQEASGPCSMEGVLFEVDEKSGHCISTKRVEVLS